MSAEIELHRRAKAFAQQSILKVDYYRIRRRFAWQLPITEYSEPPSEPLASIPVYPWTTWLLWSLEERIFSLGWATQFGATGEIPRAARRDLEALAAFPVYFLNSGRMTLDASHAGRILGVALTEWDWLDEPLRATLRKALGRYLDEAAPAIAWAFEDAKAPEPRIYQNIPLIGVLVCAMAAAIIDHPSRENLHCLSMDLLRFVGERQKSGSEGICYDGYVLDFALSWLRALPEPEAAEIAASLNLDALFHRTLALGLPGNPADLALIGDIEPVEMPFHLSAQIKLERIRSVPGRAAWLRAIPLSRLRAEALAHFPDRASDPEPWADRGVLDGGYVVSLRNGGDGLFPVVSVHRSPFSHLHKDNGHLCIGSRNEWLITDPGYQQYLATSERRFSLGPSAHNCPVINGAAQTKVPSRRAFKVSSEAGWQRLVVDLSEAYAAEAGIRTARRTIWLTKEGVVVVADSVESDRAALLEYFWHGGPQCFWEGDEHSVGLHGDEASLFIQTAGLTLGEHAITRLSGSRGSLTLRASACVSAATDRPVWWVFTPSRPSAPLVVDVDGRDLVLPDGLRLSING